MDADLSRDVRQYLKYPNKLFRRVRDKGGMLRLSKADAAFHPGAGVYRSSYMNALRMTATEINTAYRTADYLRWRGMPFVLGIEIRITDTHRHEPDICDDLKGRYPKEFKFTGWHPWCRCYAVPILPPVGELSSFDEEHPKGEVKDVPKAFKEWVKMNGERISRAKKIPGFLKENERWWKGRNNSNNTLGEDVRQRRREIRNKAKGLTKKTLRHKAFAGKEIHISNKGIKEWLNQPHSEYAAKNELLLKLREELPKMKYLGYGRDRHNASIKMHLFETEVNGRPSWVIARELPSGETLIHSITDSEGILE